MNIFAVIVTYGNRFHFLKRVIDSALREDVSKIIVVDNNSEPGSKEKLKDYEIQLGKEKLKVIYLDDNYGSALGYKKGIKEAYRDSECDFIWLLDDDNEPQKGSLKALKIFWNSLRDEKKNENVSLLSFRPDRFKYKEAIMLDNPNLVLGRKNSFLGFHVLDLPKKIMRKIKRLCNITTFIDNQDKRYGKISVAPYGGMFLHKNLIRRIGYPNEKFFVYADDHDWSYRITKENGNIYLLLDSLVIDIDTSWNVNKQSTIFSIIAKGSPFRIYYSTRNRIYFELDNLVDNKFIYYINIKVFCFLLQLFRPKKKSIKSFKKAIENGLETNLGKTFENINF